jgi:hypothetical protein
VCIRILCSFIFFKEIINLMRKDEMNRGQNDLLREVEYPFVKRFFLETCDSLINHFLNGFLHNRFHLLEPRFRFVIRLNWSIKQKDIFHC